MSSRPANSIARSQASSPCSAFAVTLPVPLGTRCTEGWSKTQRFRIWFVVTQQDMFFFSGNLKFVINNVELFKKVFEFHMIHVFCLNVDWQQRGLFDYLFTYTYIVRTSKECCRFSIKCSFQQECFKRNIYRMNPQKAYAKIS